MSFNFKIYLMQNRDFHLKSNQWIFTNLVTRSNRAKTSPSRVYPGVFGGQILFQFLKRFWFEKILWQKSHNPSKKNPENVPASTYLKKFIIKFWITKQHWLVRSFKFPIKSLKTFHAPFWRQIKIEDKLTQKFQLSKLKLLKMKI